MSASLKFNTPLLDEKDFQDQPELMFVQELTGAIIRNSWRAKLKDRIGFFAADFSRRLKLDRLAAQRVRESRVDRVVKAEDSVGFFTQQS